MGVALEGQRSAAAEFVFLPHRQMHASWLGELLPEPAWRLLDGCSRIEGRLAAFVAERVGLPSANAETLAFETPISRFCLLPGTALLNIAKALGLVLNAARLKCIVDGRLVARVRRELGLEALAFALTRGPLITNQADPLPLDVEGEDRLDLQVERSGVNYMGLALGELQPVLRERLKLKLPREHAALLCAPQGSTSPQAAWHTVRKVIREAEPKWSATLK